MAYEGDFGLTLGSLRDHFWCMRVTLNHFGITLEELFAPDGDRVETWGSFCGQDWHLRAALGALWGYFGSTCGIWGCLWDDFEVIFGGSSGSVWVPVGGFVSLDGHFAMNVESLWVY